MWTLAALGMRGMACRWACPAHSHQACTAVQSWGRWARALSSAGKARDGNQQTKKPIYAENEALQLDSHQPDHFHQETENRICCTHWISTTGLNFKEKHEGVDT